MEWLTNLNNMLEQIPKNALDFFDKTFKKGEEYTQDFVDAVCKWLAWSININVERIRQSIIKKLAKQYAGAMTVVAGVSVVKNALSDPIGSLGSVFSYFSKPYTVAKNFYQILVVEIPRLAANLANIASALPPDPPNPHINFNAFKLQIGTISIGEITGASSMPSPEQMFPEPPSPFSKAAFDSSFENAKAKTAESQVMYKLSGGSESDGTTIA